MLVRSSNHNLSSRNQSVSGYNYVHLHKITFRSLFIRFTYMWFVCEKFMSTSLLESYKDPLKVSQDSKSLVGQRSFHTIYQLPTHLDLATLTSQAGWTICRLQFICICLCFLSTWMSFSFPQNYHFPRWSLLFIQGLSQLWPLQHFHDQISLIFHCSFLASNELIFTIVLIVLTL